MSQQEINQLINRGHRAYISHDYSLAQKKFDQAIEKCAGDKSKAAWAYAYKGQMCLDMAQKMEDMSQDQDSFLTNALSCFDHALNLPEAHNSEAQIKDIEEGHDYDPWILAHRGEVLRVIGNKKPHLKKEKRDYYYNAAIKCFEEATKKDTEYAWAHAHWGATLCNQRSNDDSQYIEALSHLERALELSEYNYAWASAYKATTYMQMQDQKMHQYAFVDLAIAVRQDPRLVRQALQPPLAFDQELTPQLIYLEASWAHQKALEYRPRDKRQLLYLRYYAFLKKVYVPKREAFLLKKEEPDDEYTEIWDEISKKPKSADTLYIKAGLVALFLRDYRQNQRENKEGTTSWSRWNSTIPQLSHKFKIDISKKIGVSSLSFPRELWKSTIPRLSQGFNIELFQESIPSLSFSGELKKFKEGDDLYDLCAKWCRLNDKLIHLNREDVDHIKAGAKGDEFDQLYIIATMMISLSLLKECLELADSRAAEYQSKARHDVAWYHLRKLKAYQKIVGIQMTKEGS